MLNQVLDEVKKLIPHFETRQEQVDMMNDVYHSMKNGSKIGIHAPTGTGKSLGYLIPFIAMKLENPGFNMTISTFTINLQEQLMKDLVLMNEVYEKLSPGQRPLSYAILKGRNNYFCHKRFAEAQDSIPLSLYEKINDKTLDLLTEHRALDRQNVGIKMSQTQWETMQVEGCKKEQCPFYENCTFFEHYHQKGKDLVIVNHSLFFNRHFYVSEAWNDFHFHVFDEAHKMEKVILDAATFDLSYEKVEKWAFQGMNLAYKHEFNKEKINEWFTSSFYQNPVVLKFKAGMNALTQRLSEPAASLEKLKFKEESIFKMVEQLLEWQKETIHSFKESLVTDEKKEDATFKEDENFWAVNSLELLEFFYLFKQEKDRRLVWAEKPENGKVSLKITPKHISYLPSLFTKGTLFASGTLAQNNSCQHFAERMNVTLDIDRVMPTPFSLCEQTMVYASTTINPKLSSYESELEVEIKALLQAGEQKTFILFTSVQTMKQMALKLKPFLANLSEEIGEPIETWVQDKTNHQHIMRSFSNQDVRSILFGTLSYFEGIDLKREALTQIILTRMPFSVPTHPIQELLDQNKGYSQWEALVRYEQAFGRLIRTKQDYGTFCVLDKRVYDYPDFLTLFTKENIAITSDISEIATFHHKKRH